MLSSCVLRKTAKRAVVIIIIIIIIDFYGAYILRNLSSEAQQNRISRRNRKQGRAKVSIRKRDNRTFMVIIRFRVTLGVLLDLQLNELLEVW